MNDQFKRFAGLAASYFLRIQLGIWITRPIMGRFSNLVGRISVDDDLDLDGFMTASLKTNFTV